MLTWSTTSATAWRAGCPTYERKGMPAWCGEGRSFNILWNKYEEKYIMQFLSRFANLFETSQSLFWATFGLVSLTDFELTGIKEFTRFWALLMFGSYSVCNIIVLLNMLIAMMSNR